jgi:hypothetical protein
MNCVELQGSLAEVEDGSGTEQQAHLKSCPECSALVTELNRIASVAEELRASEEPSSDVWNSIEVVLRQEGLIREPRASRSRTGRSLIPSFGSRWGWARWAVPAAATLLFALGIYVHQRSQPVQLAQNTVQPQPNVSAVVSDLELAGLNDNDLLEAISQQAPALRAQYEDNLRSANQYIEDAKSDVAANPNDEEARCSLLAAYQQKAMLFELALDRSLP